MELILSSAGSYPRIGDSPETQRHRRAYAQQRAWRDLRRRVATRWRTRSRSRWSGSRPRSASTS